MNASRASWRGLVVRAVVLSLSFAVLFGLVGSVGGFLVGMGLSAYDEIVRHVGNPQGPLLFLFTGPLGVATGFIVGLWMAIRDAPGDVEGSSRKAA